MTAIEGLMGRECRFLATPAAFEQQLDASVQRDWVVYAKRPFGGPQQVLRYLARYTHRVAISDRRLLELKDGQICFQYKDYADAQRSKAMTLSSCEFIRRFLMQAAARNSSILGHEQSPRIDYPRRSLLLQTHHCCRSIQSGRSRGRIGAWAKTRLPDTRQISI